MTFERERRSREEVASRLTGLAEPFVSGLKKRSLPLAQPIDELLYLIIIVEFQSQLQYAIPNGK